MVTWEDLGSHDYTGMFEGGYDNALIRLSESSFDVLEAPGLTPSFAMKFTRDGIESVNLFGATGFEPTDSFDFFKYDFSNHLEVHENSLNRETIMLKLAEAGGGRVGSTGLGEFARFKKDGTPVDPYKPPFRLIYMPSSDVRGLFGDDRPEEGENFMT